ncbi:MAG: hypothetical protein COA67_09245 [Lutibacter sp.]|nr:MAG: hypothetical protein COA67_09245 [Lutibacter sp.]
MKKLICLGLIVLLCKSCKAQIVPVEEVVNYFDNVEEGETTYIKDVNNVLDNYVGTWKGTLDNKEYTFVITEKTVIFDEEYNILQDKLLMRHKIIDVITNVVIEDTLLVLDDDVHLEGFLFETNNVGDLSYTFSYYGDTEGYCGRIGDVAIALFNSNTQMKSYLKPSRVSRMIDPEIDCPNGILEQIIPELLVLTKQ